MPFLQKVNPGQPIGGLEAANVNAWTDAALFARQFQSGSSGSKGRPIDDTTEITVKNKRTDGVLVYRAMALYEPIIKAADNEQEFKSRVIMKGRKPTAADEGRWGITQEPLAADALGYVVVSGVTVAWINLTTTGDKAVEITSGSDIPVGGDSGLASILWVAGGVGTATATGEQWAIIRIGGGGGALSKGQYKGQTYHMGTDFQAVWDYPTAVATLSDPE